MRRRHRKGNKQRKIIVGSMLCLLVLFTVGYSAFQTTLNVNVKGNVKKKTAGQELVEKVGVVDNGDGLYKDTVTDGRYYYRGSSPNNYITFNNETWRIISVESDGTLKIVRNEQLSETKAWDAAGNRNKSTSTYCVSNYCNAWVSTNNLLDTPNNFIQYYPNGNTNDSTKYTGTVTQDSTMATYLNGTYYNGLSSTAKAKIVKGTFNVSTPGNATDTESLEIDAEQEKQYQWKGYVALYTVTELLRASTDWRCTSLKIGFNSDDTRICLQNNWLWLPFNTNTDEATLSSYVGENNDYVWCRRSSGAISLLQVYSSSLAVRPVLHLSSDITLSGDGTSSSPYIIN